jgi:hypothetical protein
LHPTSEQFVWASNESDISFSDPELGIKGQTVVHTTWHTATFIYGPSAMHSV